jgi:hypothetical protein
MLLAIFTTAPLTRAEDPFTLSTQGTWSAQTYASSAFAADETLLSANVGVGYYVLNQLSLNLEAAAYGVFQDGPDAVAGDIRFGLRHHVLVRDRWSLFIDVSEGFFEASERVPEGGTRFNFIFRAGPGIAYQLHDDTYFIAGVHYWHLSNAKMEGNARNPSLNGAEAFVGLMWTFK